MESKVAVDIRDNHIPLISPDFCVFLARYAGRQHHTSTTVFVQCQVTAEGCQRHSQAAGGPWGCIGVGLEPTVFGDSELWGF